ncbi:MAG: hypothetical protein LBG44_09585 [Gemmatimonadota bacterium]|nr:hypothetical protein [Gemmatimonadota bacterium]
MADTDETPLRKNYRLHQSKIDRARKVLGTRTETDTIEQALDLVTFGEALRKGVDAMRGVELEDIFDGSEP